MGGRARRPATRRSGGSAGGEEDEEEGAHEYSRGEYGFNHAVDQGRGRPKRSSNGAAGAAGGSAVKATWVR